MMHEKNKPLFTGEEAYAHRPLNLNAARKCKNMAGRGSRHTSTYRWRQRQTDNRTQRALVKAFKAIAGSKDRDLAPLYTKIKQKEPEEFQEKQVLIYVASLLEISIPASTEKASRRNMTFAR
jgi:hypothetical protein